MGKIEATLSIEVRSGDEDMLIESLGPDSKNLVTAIKKEGKVEFKIVEDKISTIANVIEDILRCYNTFKKIVEE